jgi:predicted P-loop ATPase
MEKLMLIKIAIGQDVKSKKVKNEELTYQEFKNLLLKFETINAEYKPAKKSEPALKETLREAKNKLPWFIPSHFEENNRSNNQLFRSLIVLDVDNYPASLESLEKDLDNDLAQYKYLAYSTMNHTLEKPKIRIVVFLTENIATEQYKKISKNFVQTLPSLRGNGADNKPIVDEASYKANQFMFVSGKPNIFNLPPELEPFGYIPWNKENEAKLLDPNHFIQDTLSLELEPNNAIQHLENSTIEESRTDKDFAKTVTYVPHDFTTKQIQEHLSNYPAEKTEYCEWLDVGMALHYQYMGQEEGLNIWDKWSKTDSSRYQGIEDLKSRWQSFKSNTNSPITFATIIYRLKEQSKISWVHKGKNEAPLPTLENYQLFFEHFGIKPTYNIIKKREKIISSSLPENIHSPDIEGDKFSRIYSLCVLHGLGKDEKILRKYLSTTAHQNSFNPIKEAIEGVKHDGLSRLEEFYSKVVVPEEHDEIKRVYLKKWLMQFICMTCLNDGEKGLVARQVLVLQGKEGIGKTTFLKELLPTNLQDYFHTATAVDLKDDMQVKKLIEHAIVEFGELPATFRKSDNDAFKAFITQSDDTINIKYQINHGKYRRNTTFVASVNDEQFLNSSYENTRLLVIPVRKFKWNKKVDMLQLFAELLLETKIAKKAVEELGKNLESIYELTPKEQGLQKVLNQEFEEKKLWEELLREKLNLSNTESEKKKLSITEIIKQLTTGAKITQKDLNDCGDALRKLGLKPDGKKKYEISFLVEDYGGF